MEHLAIVAFFVFMSVVAVCMVSYRMFTEYLEHKERMQQVVQNTCTPATLNHMDCPGGE